MNTPDRLSLTDDTRIHKVEEILTPCELITENGLELDIDTAKQIRLWRKITSDIIHKKDDRILTIV
jgi:phospho-2-dehydro-3-deoxyheptonate aldolase